MSKRALVNTDSAVGRTLRTIVMAEVGRHRRLRDAAAALGLPRRTLTDWLTHLGFECRDRPAGAYAHDAAWLRDYVASLDEPRYEPMERTAEGGERRAESGGWRAEG